jgi:hypothetical protein
MRRDHGTIAALGAVAALAGLASIGGRARGSRSTHNRFRSPGVERHPWIDARGNPYPKTHLVLYENLEPDEDNNAVELRRLSGQLLQHSFDELIHRIPFSSWLDEAYSAHPYNEHLDEQTPLEVAGHVFEVVGWVPLGLRPSTERWQKSEDRLRPGIETPGGEPAAARRAGEHTVSIGVGEAPPFRNPGDLTPEMVIRERPSPHLDAAVGWVDDGNGDIAALILRYRYTFDAQRPTSAELRRLAQDVPQAFMRKRGLGGRYGHQYDGAFPGLSLAAPRDLSPLIERRRLELGLEA